jgi:Mn2+/Fe2+ NRAMP family transporter
MNEQALSHIPFQLTDELMIHSMARWMKFLGVVKIVGSMLVLFVALVALIYAGVEMVSDPAALGKMGRVLADNKLTFFCLGAFTLILAVVGTVMGFVLYQAADDFDRVVRTNEADQDYITAGLIQLETYFKVSVLLAFAAVLVGMTAGLSLALKYGAVS